MQRQSNGLIAGLIFGPLFAIIGYAVAFYVGKPILDKAQASVDWPSVPGKILKSEVDRGRSSKGKASYSAAVVYEYTIEGTKHEGDTVWFGGNYSSSDSSGAQNVVSRYPAGKEVKVHYNPKEPHVSVLETGAFFSSYLLYGIGIAFLLVGVLVTGGVAFKIALGGLLVGAAVGSSLTSSRNAPPTQFAPRPTFAPPPGYDKPSKASDDKDDGINIG